MAKTLVAYFSASGVTKGVAERLAKASGADLFEIVPSEPYNAADLDWRDKTSRSTLEALVPGATIREGKVLNGASDAALEQFALRYC